MPRALRAELIDTPCGGFTTFEGWVRDHNEGQRGACAWNTRPSKQLGVREGERIVRRGLRALRRDARALCVHRLGDLRLGEIAVWVGVAAAHRDEAFQRLPLHHR